MSLASHSHPYYLSFLHQRGLACQTGAVRLWATVTQSGLGCRYFDEDFEAAAMRCYRCGGQGHMSFNCPNTEKQRPCYLCGQFGHNRADCPNSEPLLASPACLKTTVALTSVRTDEKCVLLLHTLKAKCLLVSIFPQPPAP